MGDIDSHGILSVQAKDKNTGKEQKIIIKASGGLSKEEIERMVKDAENNEEEDKKFQKFITAKNKAEMSIHNAEKIITEKKNSNDDEEKLNNLTTEIKNKISKELTEEIEKLTNEL